MKLSGEEEREEVFQIKNLKGGHEERVYCLQLLPFLMNPVSCCCMFLGNSKKKKKKKETLAHGRKEELEMCGANS